MTRVDLLESQANSIEDIAIKQQVMDNYFAILGMIESKSPYEDIVNLMDATEKMIADYINSAIPQAMIDEKMSYQTMLEIIPDYVDLKWQVWDMLVLAQQAISDREKVPLSQLLSQSKAALEGYFDADFLSYDNQIRTNALLQSIKTDIKKKENYDFLLLKYNDIVDTHTDVYADKLQEAEMLLNEKLALEEGFVVSETEVSALKSFISAKNHMVMPSYKSKVSNALNATGANETVYNNLFNLYKDIDIITFSSAVPAKSGMYDMLSNTKRAILDKVKFVRDSYTPLYIKAEEYYLNNKLAECYEYVLFINKYITKGAIAPAFTAPPRGELNGRLSVIADFLPSLSGVALTRFSVGIEKAEAMILNNQFNDCEALIAGLEIALIDLGYQIPHYRLAWLTGIDYMAYSPSQFPYSQGWHAPLHTYMNNAYNTQSAEDEQVLYNYIDTLINGLGEMAGMPQDRNRYWSGYNTKEIYTDADLENYLYNIDFNNISNNYSVAMLPYVSLGKASADATILTQTMRVSVHLTYYALTALKMYEGDAGKQELYNFNLNSLKASVNNWMRLQEFAGNGVFPFPDISSMGGNVGNTCKALIAAGIPTKTDTVPLSQGGLGKWIIEDYLTDGGLQYDNGLIVGAMYYVWDYFKDKDAEFANRIKDSILWNADTFLLNHNLVKNFNYNSFTVEALAYAYALSNDNTYLEDAIKKFKYGTISGMMTEGKMIGRWFDNHNAKMVYQTILARGAGTLLKFCPADHAYYTTLKELTAMAYQGVFNEIITYGSCPDGSYYESLLLEMLNLYSDSYGWTEDYITTMNIITNAFMQRDNYGTENFDKCSMYASPLWVYIQNLRKEQK
ncbi:MAG: hypothetical protein WC292_00710 [Clostridia bacterium]